MYWLDYMQGCVNFLLLLVLLLILSPSIVLSQSGGIITPEHSSSLIDQPSSLSPTTAHLLTSDVVVSITAKTSSTNQATSTVLILPSPSATITTGQTLLPLSDGITGATFSTFSSQRQSMVISSEIQSSDGPKTSPSSTELGSGLSNALFLQTTSVGGTSPMVPTSSRLEMVHSSSGLEMFSTSSTRQTSTRTMSLSPLSSPTTDSNTNSSLEYIRDNPAVLALAIALLLAVVVIFICGGLLIRERRRGHKSTDYEVPALDHAPPIYSLSQASFGVTALANDSAVYEDMSGNTQMGIGTSETFRRPKSAVATSRYSNLPSETSRNVEKEGTAAAPVSNQEGIYELDDVEGGENGTKKTLIDLNPESFYEMDDEI